MKNSSDSFSKMLKSFQERCSIQTGAGQPFMDAGFVAGFGAGLRTAEGLSKAQLEELIMYCLDYAITRMQLAEIGVEL
jgi:hypothetical protein